MIIFRSAASSPVLERIVPPFVTAHTLCACRDGPIQRFFLQGFEYEEKGKTCFDFVRRAMCFAVQNNTRVSGAKITCCLVAFFLVNSSNEEFQLVFFLERKDYFT